MYLMRYWFATDTITHRPFQITTEGNCTKDNRYTAMTIGVRSRLKVIYLEKHTHTQVRARKQMRTCNYRRTGSGYWSRSKWYGLSVWDIEICNTCYIEPSSQNRSTYTVSGQCRFEAGRIEVNGKRCRICWWFTSGVFGYILLYRWVWTNIPKYFVILPPKLIT